MSFEDGLTIVRRHRPAEAPPRIAVEAGLGASLAVVLPTHRSDQADMVLDQALWLALMQAAGGFVEADADEVFAPSKRSWLDRLRGRHGLATIGVLNGVGASLVADPDAVDWQQVVWRRQGVVVAVAVCEPWYRVGGPGLYHDSYTTCLFVAPAALDGVVATLEQAARARRVGVETSGL